MTFPGQAHGWSPAIILAFLLASPACAQDVSATVTFSPNPAKLSLSEPLRVTLAFEGAAPIRVELPKPILVPATERDWQIRPAGPASVTPLPGGRERWEQVYRLDPYVPGSDQWVGFAPVKVNGRDVTPEGFTARVLSPAVEPKADAARPVTGIEELPPSPTTGGGGLSPVWWAAGGLVIVLVAVVVWRVRRRPQPVTPAAWAVAAFERLERDGVEGTALVEAVAAVVRGFIDRRFGIPAPRLTTAELLASAAVQGWPVEQADALRRVLELCDRAKFAGDVPGGDECRELLTRGREWVHSMSPDPGP